MTNEDQDIEFHTPSTAKCVDLLSTSRLASEVMNCVESRKKVKGGGSDDPESRYLWWRTGSRGGGG